MKLLAALDAMVRSDGHPPTLKGKVTVGVRGPGGYRFWSARLGAKAETAFVDRMPADSDVTLFLDVADADAIVATGQVPRKPQLLMIDGDRKLMSRFLARYASRTSWVGVQASRT